MVSMLLQCYKINEGEGPQTHVGLVYDQRRSEGHDEPGCDLTALFTVMHSLVSYLKPERFCLTCTSGQHLNLLTGPSPFALSISSVLSKRSKKSNQTHTETPANTYCTMYSVEAQSEEAEGLPNALFFGLLYPHEYTHYSKYSKYSRME